MSEPKKGGWSEQIAPYKEYWGIYGGWRALFRSIYFHASLAITALCFPLWLEECWWELSFSLLPSLIGFLIGTFGLMLAFGGDYFKSLMAKAPGKRIHSALDIASASFCHFLVVQFAGLMVALLAKSAWALQEPSSDNAVKFDVGWLTQAFWAFGFFLLVYSVACALASVMTIFRIARQITIVENVAAMPLSGTDPPEQQDAQDQ